MLAQTQVKFPAICYGLNVTIHTGSGLSLASGWWCCVGGLEPIRQIDAEMWDLNDENGLLGVNLYGSLFSLFPS